MALHLLSTKLFGETGILYGEDENGSQGVFVKKKKKKKKKKKISSKQNCMYITTASKTHIADASTISKNLTTK